MPRRIGIAVVLLALGVVIGATLRPNLAADPPKEEKKEKPIPIDEVRKRGVLGDLGHPLGTIVRIEGEAADGKDTGAKGDEGQTLLRVKSVNGVELKEPAVFHFVGADPDKPKKGAKFKYIGYETAKFEGEVDGNELYRPVLFGGTTRYGLKRSFWIYKDELKPEKK